MRRFTTASILLISAIVFGIELKADRAVDLENSLPARVIAAKLPYTHITGHGFDKSTATNALNLFLSTLDFNRIYFLQSDIATFREEAVDIHKKLKKGDITLSEKIVNTFINRVSNRVDFVENFFKNEPDITQNETFLWKRSKTDWPTDKKEWDNLWRKKILNEYIARLVADKLAQDDKNGKPDEAEALSEETDSDLLLTPEEFILKKYRQFLILMQDNDLDWIQQTYLSAFMQALDPHSQYLSPNTMKNFEISMKLSLVGIGAVLRSEDGAAKVVKLIPGGAAESDKRLKPGDKIIAVAQDDEPPVTILHMPLDKAVMLIRGKKGTKVVLHVLPASDPSGSTIRKIDLIRDEVKLEEQRVKSNIEEVEGADGETRKLGVITVPAFYANIGFSDEAKQENVSCSLDVAQALEKMKAENVSGIILDLRNNGGGSLNEAIEMTGLFIETGPVVQLKDRYTVTLFKDTDPTLAYDGPMAVLVNRQSASASEIVAGALQDYGRAIIIGDSKTHGKGTVQTMMALEREQPDLGALKITTARFHRIAGEATQIHGVTPDIVMPSMLDNLEIGEEYLPHALVFNKISAADFEKFKDLSNIVAELDKKSTKRRLADPDFEAFETLLEKISKRLNAEEVSLNFDERLMEARERKELDKFAGDDETEGEDAPVDDLLLKESLNILSDLIIIKKSVAGPEKNTLRKGKNDAHL